MSARTSSLTEKAVRATTDVIEAATSENPNTIGAVFNRQAVSAIKVLGEAADLLGADETAQALKTASTEVTRADERAENSIKKVGLTPHWESGLQSEMQRTPEFFKDIGEGVIKGDFSEKDTYGIKVGQVVGGLNPAADIRDIIANSKNVFEGKDGAIIGLAGAVVGIVPFIGDAGKIVFRVEKDVIAETAEKLVKQGVKQETAEKIAKEEVEKLVKEAVEKQYDEIATSGHAVQRHGEAITERQLNERAMHGIDPVTGTTDDAYNKLPDGTPKPHNSAKNATKFTSKESLVKAEIYARNTQKYKDAVSLAETTGSDYITVKDIKLEDVFGADYKNQVFGKTRLGSRNNPTGTAITDFTDGTLTAKFKKDASGKWNLDTMFPEPKP